MVRTSINCLTPYERSVRMNSSSVRVECPTVKMVSGGLVDFFTISTPSGMGRGGDRPGALRAEQDLVHGEQGGKHDGQDA